MALIPTRSAVALKPWDLAKDRFLEDLPSNERELFKDATLENIFYSTSVQQKKHASDSKLLSASKRLEPFLQCVEGYGKALDVISNSAPLILSPLWGGLRVILHVRLILELYH